MAAKKKSDAPEAVVSAYEKMVATVPEAERKGATHPYTAINGNMYSYVHPSGRVALRLPEDERNKFLEKYKSTLFEAYGIVQKEYVTVPDALLGRTKELQPYFAKSFAYAKSLKPKPSKKKA
jgi:hypothetical protein